MHWIIGPNSTLDLEHKVLLYKCIIKPIWNYGIQLWGSACESNVQKLQRRQSRLLRQIVCAPWYICKENIYRDLSISIIHEEIKKYAIEYVDKLTTHPKTLAKDLFLFEGHQRLKRSDTHTNRDYRKLRYIVKINKIKVNFCTTKELTSKIRQSLKSKFLLK